MAKRNTSNTSSQSKKSSPQISNQKHLTSLQKEYDDVRKQIDVAEHCLKTIVNQVRLYYLS